MHAANQKTLSYNYFALIRRILSKADFAFAKNVKRIHIWTHARSDLRFANQCVHQRTLRDTPYMPTQWKNSIFARRYVFASGLVQARYPVHVHGHNESAEYQHCWMMPCNLSAGTVWQEGVQRKFYASRRCTDTPHIEAVGISACGKIIHFFHVRLCRHNLWFFILSLARQLSIRHKLFV